MKPIQLFYSRLIELSKQYANDEETSFYPEYLISEPFEKYGVSVIELGDYFTEVIIYHEPSNTIFLGVSDQLDDACINGTDTVMYDALCDNLDLCYEINNPTKDIENITKNIYLAYNSLF